MDMDLSSRIIIIDGFWRHGIGENVDIYIYIYIYIYILYFLPCAYNIVQIKYARHGYASQPKCN